VPVDESQKGRTWPPFSYEVGLEKIREYANAIGEQNPVHHDREAARGAGFRDVVAPPMFAVVYSGRAVWPAVHDPAVGLDFSMLVHGGQEFEWGPVVVAGDEISTTATIKDISERGGMGFYVFESVAENQRGETVCTGKWTNIVRGSE
jgi:acyl dehydratase